MTAVVIKPSTCALLICGLFTLTTGCASDRAPVVSSNTDQGGPGDADADPQDAGPDLEEDADDDATGDASDNATGDDVTHGDDADDGDAPPPPTPCPDLDQDGFPQLVEGCTADVVQFDCDDGDGQINPGAQELCDDEDNDCDDEIDEGVVNACGGCEPLDFEPGEPCGECGVAECATSERVECVGIAPTLYFQDGDGDGFGAGDPRALCAPEAPFTTEFAGDCDDTDRDVSPDALEVCDGGTDNDCDEGTTELSVCPLLRFDARQNKWVAPSLDMTHPLAPSDPVQAAFTGKDDGAAWLMTRRTWHRFNVADNTWRDSGRLRDDLPEIDDLIVRWAYALPGSHIGEQGMRLFVYIGGGAVFSFQSSPDFSTFEFLQPLPLSGWDTEFAPANSEDAQAVWLDLNYSQDWFSSSPGDLCAEGADRELEVISGIITPDALHLQEAGYCFGFAERVPNDAFFPFTRRGAPAAGTIQAAFWLDSLYVWRDLE